MPVGSNGVRSIVKKLYEVSISEPYRFFMDKQSSGDIYLDFTPHDHINVVSKRTYVSHAISVLYITKSTSTFTSMSPEKRGCRLPNEGQLALIGEDIPYNQPNCELQCAWRVGQNLCRCVPWFLVQK